jgi:hypothetical protein
LLEIKRKTKKNRSSNTCTWIWYALNLFGHMLLSNLFFHASCWICQ